MKKGIFLFIFFVCSYTGLFSQSYCSTKENVPDPLQQIPPAQLLLPANANVVRIFVHVMRRSNGSGGQTQPAVTQALNYLVDDFEDHNICVSLSGTDEILNDTYYDQSFFTDDGNGDGKFDNFSPNAHANAIDVYLFGTDASFAGGIAANIGATALVVGGFDFGTNLAASRVISHEFGHCLGLFHTFHGLCESGCRELVNGSNCSTCGDFVCDTPPDPQQFATAFQCTWNGATCNVGSTDANGQPYNPNMHLIMAYVPPYCMEVFTTGQGTRMRTTIANSALLQNVIVPNSLVISSLTIGSGVNRMYDVVNTLTAQTSVIVQANGSLTFRAGSSIVLSDHFHAQSSSSFHAYIDEACSTVDNVNAARSATNVKTEILKDSSKEAFSDNDFRITIYPNPVNRLLNVDIEVAEGRMVEVKIMSVYGTVMKSMRTGPLHNGKQRIGLDVSNLAPGTYFIHFSEGAHSISKKVIKLD